MPKQKGVTLWFTGLSGSGKTTIAKEVERILKEKGYKVERLDGDEIREYLCRDLGFSKEDRDENIRRISYVAKLLTMNDVITLCCFISPYRKARQEARELIGEFVEVYINAPLAVCEERDVKGLYKKARTGELEEFTGVSDPYQEPIAPDIEINSYEKNISECSNHIINYLYDKEYIMGTSHGQS